MGAPCDAVRQVIDAFQDHAALLIGTAGVLGLLIGSFLNVVIHRLPLVIERGNVQGMLDWLGDLDEYFERFVTRGGTKDAASLKSRVRALGPAFKDLLGALPDVTLSRPRSRCGHCGHAITAAENIPVVSYLALRGRCRGCGTSISLRYPGVELLTGALFAAVAWKLGFTIAMAASLVLVAVLVALTFIDAEAMLLPDSLTLPLLWLGLLLAVVGGPVRLSDAVLGAAAGYLSLWSVFWAYKLLTGKEGFGYGDFKLLAALGAWFGWQAILPIVLLSAVVGAVVGISLIVAGRKTMASKLPFGVYLAPAGIVMLFAGREIVEAIVPTLA